MVWYRLKWTLSRDGWLTTRQCDHVTVTQWTHGLLSTAIRHRYLSNDSTRRQLHGVLATYWLGSSDDDVHGHQDAIKVSTLCGSGGGGGGGMTRHGPPVVYDSDQPLIFDCELAPGKPRYLLFFNARRFA